jgi:hypothetical protein
VSNCPGCGHDAHAPQPCTACALLNTTCWTGIEIVGGDGDKEGRGEIELASGLEARPCLHCTAFEKDEKKLRDHLIASGLQMDAQGRFLTPIAKDFKGRKSLAIDPRSYGFCRADQMPVDMLATCEKWTPVRTSSEFESRIKPS